MFTKLVSIPSKALAFFFFHTTQKMVSGIKKKYYFFLQTHAHSPNSSLTLPAMTQFNPISPKTVYHKL